MVMCDAVMPGVMWLPEVDGEFATFSYTLRVRGVKSGMNEFRSCH